MIITIRRTGGFAGVQETLGTVDTADLSAEAQRTFADCLRALGGLAGSPSPGADQFRYEVEIQEPGRPSILLSVMDEGDPKAPNLRALNALMESLDLAVP